MAFVIVSDETKKVSGGKIVTETFHYVADEANGALVGRAAHKSIEDAQAELESMAGLVDGMEFANAQFPHMTDKARVGKANVVAEYLAWVAAGKPIKALPNDSACVHANMLPIEADETF